jgi:hypothetical protein
LLDRGEEVVAADSAAASGSHAITLRRPPFLSSSPFADYHVKKMPGLSGDAPQKARP